MYYEWGNCFFTLQIFVAELIFLYSYPKRSKFLARIIPGVIAITLLSGFMPSGYTLMRNQYYQFFKYIFMFAVTAAYQCFCFKAKIIAMISACVSGYALQHLSYQAMQLLSLTSLLDIPAISSSWRDRILELMVFPFTYLLTWAAFGRMAAKYEFYKNYDSRFVAVSIFTLFVCLVINRFARQGASLGNAYVIAGNALYAISCCVLSLFISYSLVFRQIAQRSKSPVFGTLGISGFHFLVSSRIILNTILGMLVGRHNKSALDNLFTRFVGCLHEGVIFKITHNVNAIFTISHNFLSP